MSQDDKSLSKIDRFLACHGFLAHWNMASVTALTRLHSDHSPLILFVLDSWGKPIEGCDNDKLLLRKLQLLKIVTPVDQG